MLLADALQPQRLVVLELDVVGRIIIFQVEFGLELALLLRFRFSLFARLFFALLRFLLLLPSTSGTTSGRSGRICRSPTSSVSRLGAFAALVAARRGAEAALRCGATAVSLAAAARRPVRGNWR